MTRKRKRGEFEASHMMADPSMGIEQQDEPLTTSKRTRRRQVVEDQVAFLQMGFRHKPAAPWLTNNMSKKDSYPVIIRRRTLSLDE
jgi:hypothetical protein